MGAGQLVPVAPVSTITVAASDTPAKFKAQADYVCDGIADDVQIQAALSDIPTEGGKVLLLDGNFLATRIEMPTNTTLEGMGLGTVLKLADETDDRFITQQSWPDGEAENISISNMLINGNNTNQTEVGTSDSRGNAGCIDIKHVTGFNFHNLTINDPWTTGIETTFSSEGEIYRNIIRRSADDCIAVNEGSSLISVFGNQVVDPAYNKDQGAPHGIEVQDGASYVDVIKNRIMLSDYTAGSSVNAIGINSHSGVAGCHHILIADNIIKSELENVSSYILIQGVTSALQATDIIVRDNIIDESSPGGGKRIYLVNVERASISGNISNGNAGYDVLFSGTCEDIDLHNNQFDGGSYCVYWYASSITNNLRIRGNRFESTYKLFDLTAGGITLNGVRILENDVVKIANSDWDFYFPASDNNSYSDVEVANNRFHGWNMRFHPSDTDISSWNMHDNTNAATVPYTVISSDSITPWASEKGQYTVTALAANTTINAPLGMAIDAKIMTIRIKATGGNRTVAWNAIYRSVEATLPAIATSGKVMYVGLRYNSQDTKWDCVAVSTQA